MRHFLKETDFSQSEAAAVFAAAGRFKADRLAATDILGGQSWGLLFFKSSTRTRVSFEVGIHELGGHPVALNSQSTQIGRGESIEDTARVLGRYLHGLVIRTFDHAIIEGFAEHSGVPVVNALTDFLHPCQVYSDLFTLAEKWSDGEPADGVLAGRRLAFVGDTASNMAHSLILGGALFGMEVAVAGPEGFEPAAELKVELDRAGLDPAVRFTSDPREAVAGADAVYTDVWVSMGDEAEAEQRRRLMAPYQVDGALFDAAKPDALFMHCLPAHPGEEVTQDVLDSPRSVIFDQAENRLHVQKAILGKLAAERGG